jgi:hypothetical protein
MKHIFLALSVAGCLSACATQPLTKKTLLIEPGMSKDDVLSVMGSPGNRQFKGNKEAWQYCQTGWSADEYILIWLVDGTVAQTQTYANTEHGGLCTSFFRTVDWEEAPDAVVEIRSR